MPTFSPPAPVAALRAWRFTAIKAMTSLAFAASLIPANNAQASPQPTKAWWTALQDPEIKTCIRRALRANPELAQAQLAIEQAKNTARERLTPLLPQLSGEISVNSGPIRSLGFQFGAGPGGNTGAPTNLPLLYAMGSALLRANLQIDLAGRAILNRKASRLNIHTQEVARADQREALVLQVLSAYLDASAARAQLATLREQVQTLQALIETTARRVELGDRSAVDVLNQKQQLARVNAQLPLAQLQLEAFLAQLARLQGQSPGSSYGDAMSLDPAPWLALAKIPKSNPLQQRSVQVAKRQLQAAQMQETRAKRAWAPSLQVGAEAGVQGRYLGNFFSQGYWRMNALLSVPLYQGGQVKTETQRARLQRTQAQFKLSQAQLDAQKRWADLQSQVRLRKANLEALNTQRSTAQLAAHETQRRYLAGTGNYLEVLTALNTVTGVELALITARRDLISAALSLRSFAANTSSP